MTLLAIEGFDHLTTAQLVDKGWGNFLATVGDYGRFGTKGIMMGTSSSYLSRNFNLSSKSTLYYGFALKKVDAYAPSYQAADPLVSFNDESQVSQVKFYVNAANGIQVRQGDGTILGTTADGVIKEGKYHFIEVKITVSATVGVVEIKIDETQVLNLTSQDTKNGSDYLSHIIFKSIYNQIDVWIDDIYIYDADFLGNCHVKTFYPDADGNSSDFTRSTGSNDYECVDETPSNEDTDYISSDTLNHKSIFGITTGSLPTVKGIQLNNHCKLDEAGARKITPIIRSNSTDYQGTESNALVEDYAFESEIFEDDPDDSGVWTQTKLEAAEFGLEITT